MSLSLLLPLIVLWSNGDGPRDRVLVKLATDVAVRENLVTGVTALDHLNRELGAVTMRRVFRDVPRGHQNPAAWRQIGLDRWYRIEFANELADIDGVVQRYAGVAVVQHAERNRAVEPIAIPNDPDYVPQQWDLKANRTDAEHAWDVITDSSSLVVFVVDTGVQVAHSDIGGNLWHNPGEIPGNGIDDDANGFIDDEFGWNFQENNNDVDDNWPHGMHVNGIIGAMGNNNNKVAGINWKCRLAQGKIFSHGGGTWENGAAATVYAVDNGAGVINNSWGGGDPPQVYLDALQYSDQSDVLNVAAAGNTGGTEKFYPAALPEMLSVSSTDINDNLSGFSTHGTWIDMSAPGEGIFNLWIGDSTATLSGTSMASPHVTGAGALVRALNPQLTNLESRLVLRHASDDLGLKGFDGNFGWGRLDIHQAVDTARSIKLSATKVNAGTTVEITLANPDEGNKTYALLSTKSGHLPGIPLATYDATDARVFPLNPDFWMLWSIQPNPFTSNFISTLDAGGNAKATFAVPNHPYFKGETFSLAYVTFDPADLSHVRFISAPISFSVNP